MYCYYGQQPLSSCVLTWTIFYKAEISTEQLKDTRFSCVVSFRILGSSFHYAAHVFQCTPRISMLFRLSIFGTGWAHLSWLDLTCRNCSIIGIHRQIRLFKNWIQEYLHILNIGWHMYRVHRFDHSHQVIISIAFLYGIVFTGVLENQDNQKWFLKQLHILFIILSAFLNEIVSLEICLFHHTYERIVREYQSVTVRFCVIQCKKFLPCFFVYWKL